MKIPLFDVIYLNGGIGQRINLGYPKQFALLNGIPIIIYGLEELRQCKNINKIILPTAPEAVKKTMDILDSYNITNYLICENGKTRQSSVYEGLKHVETENVLITEAVRPFINQNLLMKIILNDNENVIPRNKTIATLINNNGTCLNRDFCGMVQMPQRFNTELLKVAHKKATHNNYTDDAQLMADTIENFSPEVIKGIEQNIKITSPLDLYIAEAIIKYLEGVKYD